MHLIIGGAYQGKREYAKGAFGLKEEDIFLCPEEGEPDFSFPCIAGLARFAAFYAGTGRDAVAFFRENRARWENSVLIAEDIFCGVVPMGAQVRAGREAAGRLFAYLAAEAESVTRIFLGLPQRLK